MKQSEFLQLLKSDPDEQIVRHAIDWLKKQEPSSKGAQVVLRELLFRPEFTGQLGWLADWMKNGLWDCVIDLATKIPNIELYDWYLHLLATNPKHPQAAALWSNMLSEYRDPALNEKALTWFLDAEISSDAIYVGSKLAAEVFSPEFLSKAKVCLAADPENWCLLAGLIASGNCNFAVKPGLHYLKNVKEIVLGHMVALALLENDLNAHLPAVDDFWNKHKSSKHFASVTRSAFQEFPALIPLRFEQWTSKKIQGKRLPVELSLALSRESDQLIIDFASNWICANKNNFEMPMVLKHLLQTPRQIKLPAEIFKLTRSWLESSKEDQEFWHVQLALIHRLTDDHPAQCAQILNDAPDEHYGRILLEIVRFSKENLYREKALEWLETCGENVLAPSMTLALLENFPSDEITRLARQLLPTDDRTMNVLLTVALVKQKEQRAATEANKEVETRTIPHRWKSWHHDRFLLLDALLNSPYCNQGTLTAASNWLKLKPYWYERVDYDKIRQAFLKASAKLHLS